MDLLEKGGVSGLNLESPREQVSRHIQELNNFQPQGNILDNIKQYFGILEINFPPGYNFEDPSDILRYFKDYKSATKFKLGLVGKYQKAVLNAIDKILRADKTGQF